MSGVAFSVLFLLCLFILLPLSVLLPVYVCLWASKKLYLSIATIKSVTVLNFKPRSKISHPIFVGDVTFLEDEKKSPHAAPPKTISTRLTWHPGAMVFNTKRAERLLFDKDVPCTLDFYIVKWLFLSRYTGIPVQSFEKIYKNKLKRITIIIVVMSLLWGILQIRKEIIAFSKTGFTPVETLELTGRLGKTWLRSKGNLENRVQYEMTLSYLNELCPPSAVRPLCQERDRLIKRLAEPPKDPQFNE